MVLWLNVCDKEHLTLRNNFRVTKKLLITNFDCIRLSLFHSDRLAVTIKAPVWKTRYQLSEFKSRYGPFIFSFDKMAILKSSLHNFL